MRAMAILQTSQKASHDSLRASGAIGESATCQRKVTCEDHGFLQSTPIHSSEPLPDSVEVVVYRRNVEITALFSTINLAGVLIIEVWQRCDKAHKNLHHRHLTASSTRALLQALSLADVDCLSSVSSARCGRSHALLDLGGHGDESLLDIGSVLCRSLEEGLYVVESVK